MSVISVLDPDVVKKIAAGEVIERPASIVKELLENAVDAGATSISVEIKGGGTAAIRVADNGCGMDEEDAPVAFLRHATSKIKEEKDLTAIATLGFRGEALFSIATVSQIEMRTRTAQNESGMLIVNHFGEIGKHLLCACNEGTNISIKNVFSNMPARLKFLKSAQTEAAMAGEAVSREIIGRPEISFRFVSDGKPIYHSPGDGDVRSAIFAVYGPDTAKHLIAVSRSKGGLSLHGYIGDTVIARHNRSGQNFYVNGRYVQFPGASMAVQQAFGSRLMTRKYPFFALFLQVEKENIDVNVHPQKLQVRFSDEKMIRGFIYDSVLGGLKDHENRGIVWTGTGGSKPSKTALEAAEKGETGFDMPERDDLAAIREVLLERRAQSKTAHTLKEPQTIEEVPFGQTGLIWPLPHRVAGTVFETYALVESGEKLFFIDQHAAHERILYEQLMKETEAGKPASQKLLIPFVLHLSPAEFALFMQHAQTLSRLGFEPEEFGGYSVRIHAVPHILGQPQLSSFFEEFISKMDEITTCSTAKAKEEAVIRMACRKAVKAGDTLEPEEIEHILQSYSSGETLLTCPHGRPIVLSIEKRALEKGFKRLL